MLKISAGLEGEEPFFEARFDAKELVNDPEDYLDKLLAILKTLTLPRLERMRQATPRPLGNVRVDSQSSERPFYDEQHLFYRRKTGTMMVLRGLSLFGGEITLEQREAFTKFLDTHEPEWTPRGGNKENSLKRHFETLVRHNVVTRPSRGTMRITEEGTRQVEVSLGMIAETESGKKQGGSSEPKLEPSRKRGGDQRSSVLRALADFGEFSIGTQKETFVAFLDEHAPYWTRAQQHLKLPLVRNVLQVLLDQGLVERPRRGSYRVSDLGRAKLNSESKVEKGLGLTATSEQPYQGDAAMVPEDSNADTPEASANVALSETDVLADEVQRC